ncbi:hypothetical protein BDV41DRAFT_350192 [Aspergillus transmontanensis]|uniref:Uncharacterized protein n=1 Tax=Aspergillus transmontanensis TaxID=1034304 RepID=A0A5N6VRI5_9EURO|nr:hypothetical protein BDV41DRAFT_350192 [Aspergillus transmontanensis]
MTRSQASLVCMRVLDGCIFLYIVMFNTGIELNHQIPFVSISETLITKVRCPCKGINKCTGNKRQSSLNAASQMP